MSVAPLDPEDRRRAALHCLLCEQPGVLARHPLLDTAQVREAGDIDLRSLLIDELPLEERRARVTPSVAASDSNIGYYLRRREVALRDEWRVLLGTLPDFWRVLIELSPNLVDEFIHLLGVEMVARMAAGKSKAMINDLLMPLDRPLAEQVLTRTQAVDPDSMPLSVTSAWEKLYRHGAKRRIGQRLIRWICLALLSDLIHQRLTATRRSMAARHSRSNVLSILKQPSRPIVPAQHAGDVEAVALQLLGSLTPINDAPAS